MSFFKTTEQSSHARHAYIYRTERESRERDARESNDDVTRTRTIAREGDIEHNEDGAYGCIMMDDEVMEEIPNCMSS